MEAFDFQGWVAFGAGGLGNGYPVDTVLARAGDNDFLLLEIDRTGRLRIGAAGCERGKRTADEKLLHVGTPVLRSSPALTGKCDSLMSLSAASSPPI